MAKIVVDAAGVYEESKKRDLARKVSKFAAPLKNIKPLRKVYHKLLGASDYDRAPENMKKTNMLESDKKLNLEKVSTPATILWGKMDSVTPPRQAAVMHRHLKNSEIKYFENWTHAPYICDPSGLAKAIYAVMEKHS